VEIWGTNFLDKGRSIYTSIPICIYNWPRKEEALCPGLSAPLEPGQKLSTAYCIIQYTASCGSVVCVTCLSEEDCPTLDKVYNAWNYGPAACGFRGTLLLGGS